MSKADAQALFGKQAVQVNAIKLDKGEMAQTEGEYLPFWIFYGAAWGGVFWYFHRAGYL
jgi:hypothetical protein